MRTFLLIACLASPAFAETCPAVPDHSIEIRSLLEEARGAANENEGRLASNKMWKVWLRAPDEAAQQVLDSGMSKRRSFNYAGAFEDFATLVNYCPNYAEGYNQRAFISFLREDFPRALIDLDKALELLPNHVAAQSGRALTLMNLGRLEEAREQLLAAVKNNPWLSERTLLEKGAPLGPVGEDI
ncbi:MAG: tetratricopeptide repeat protein [Paracoccaceae bacterium]